ncbi:unnamed protein product [Ambrosiozyma monospora]|uniref:Autophagy-related protein 13 n=1 Tax=Ambrosiozyma monospora TaxID=43982 RepID=A0A9W6YUR7_AMBMO|nr:unnamed protein product [Ambrosiozyma monospora]
MSSIYKRMIVLFRALYMLVRLLPTYKLMNRLSKNTETTNPIPIKIMTKVLNGNKTINSKGRIGLSKRILGHNDGKSHLNSKKLDPIITTIGAMKLSVSYRTNCDFYIEDKDDDLPVPMIQDQYQQQPPIHMQELPKYTSVANEIPTTTSPSSHKTQPRDITPVSIAVHTQNVADDTDRVSLHSPTIEHHKSRLSETPSMGHSPGRRRSSNRSVPLFKVGSLASSASPPSGSILQVSQPSSSNHTTLKPIPVSITKNNSAASLVATLRQHRESLPRSVSSTANNYFVNASGGSGGSAERLAGVGLESTAIGVPSSQPMTSTSSKFSSSFGNRFKGSSRNNSIDSHVAGALANPVLQNFRARNKSMSGSPPDPSNSLYIDDDIDTFMRLIDSRPDLRFASSRGNTSRNTSSGINVSSQVENSLNNFKSMKKSNDQLFNNFETSILATRSNDSNLDSIGSFQPSISCSVQLQQSKDRKFASLSRNNSTSSNYSPSQILKASAPSSTVMTPAHSYANRFSSSPPNTGGGAGSGPSPGINVFLKQQHRRSSTASTASNFPSISEAIEGIPIGPANYPSSSAGSRTSVSAINVGGVDPANIPLPPSMRNSSPRSAAFSALSSINRSLSSHNITKQLSTSNGGQQSQAQAQLQALSQGMSRRQPSESRGREGLTHRSSSSSATNNTAGGYGSLTQPAQYRHHHSTSSSETGTTGSRVKLLDPEMLKLRSFNQQVFESDDDDDDEEEETSRDVHGNHHGLQVDADLAPIEQQSQHQSLLQRDHNGKSNVHRIIGAAAVGPYSMPSNASRTAMLKLGHERGSSNSVSVYGSSGYHQNHHSLSSNPNRLSMGYGGSDAANHEDDEDDLLFAMSDMTLAKNNLEF